MEEWRDIKGFEGKYQVSNLGRVKSLGNDKSRKEKILRPQGTRSSYLQIRLFKGGGCKLHYIHRLVLMTFNPVENMENLDCNHLDENKLNNRLENLEWTTHKENCNHGTRNKRVAEKLRGKPNTKCSIPVVQLALDGKLVKVWKSSMAAEREEEGFHNNAINACCKKKYSREGNNIYKGYKWQYLSYYISQIDPRIKKIKLFDKEYYVN